MALTKSSNPVLGRKIFERTFTDSYSETMTVRGAVNRVGILFLLVVLSASFVWKMVFAGTPVFGWMIFGVVGGLIAAIVCVVKPSWSPFAAPVYALMEGLFLGAISAMFEAKIAGIVFQAIGLTFGTVFALLFAYKTGIIKVTEKFKMGVIIATGGIAVFYLVLMVVNMFTSYNFFASMGLFGILISLVIVVVAALNLVLDFDFIEQGAAAGAPKYMEWYAAFGLMVTLIWLYLEILRLLSLLSGSSRD